MKSNGTHEEGAGGILRRYESGVTLALVPFLILFSLIPTAARALTPGPTKMSNKAIVLFLDGTRNTREDETNVHRLYVKVQKAGKTTDGLTQSPWYYEGVGTRMTDFVSGAVWGRGVSRDVRVGYEKLVKEYQPGDRVYIFGFSRGAFTARSLAAFVAHYGVLKRDSDLKVTDLYKDYKVADPTRPMLRLEMLQKEGKELTAAEQRLLKESYSVPIHFLGVWDTVGTIGLPIPAGQLSKQANRYHFMEPRLAYLKCCQALAVDEKRPHYRPILWKRFVPADKMNADGTPPPLSERDQRYQQRWFVGAHSNVGGGYKNPSGLYKVSLKWMEDEAAETGLGIADRQKLDGTEHLQPINDSFGDFVPYKMAWWIKPDPRPLLRPGQEKTSKRGTGAGTTGYVYTLNEVVDETVYDRVKRGGADGTPYGPVKVGEEG